MNKWACVLEVEEVSLLVQFEAGLHVVLCLSSYIHMLMKLSPFLIEFLFDWLIRMMFWLHA